jgi:hypothetical protein
MPDTNEWCAKCESEKSDRAEMKNKSLQMKILVDEILIEFCPEIVWGDIFGWKN